MSALELLSQPGLQHLSRTLLHFLWQGAVVAVVLHGVLSALGRARPRARYAASIFALGALALFPLATFCVVSRDGKADERLGLASARGADAGRPAVPSPSPGSRPWEIAVPSIADDGEAAPAAVEPVTGDREVAAGRSWLLEAQPWILGFWIAGVLLSTLGLGLGEVRLRRLRRASVPAPAFVVALARGVAERLRLRRVPAVLASAHVAQPLAMGLLRPVVLIPASWLSGLPPEGIEAILAHELAHVRRWDLWVNLLQEVLEIVGFYHPAVWWVSRRVRLERELCCDDLAVEATGRRLAYATALEFAARATVAFRRPTRSAAMGGTHMSLLHRIENVLGMCPSTRPSEGWAVWVLPLGAVLSFAVLATRVEGDDGTAPEVAEAAVEASSILAPAPQEREGDEAREARREGDRDEEEREVRREGDRERERGDREGDEARETRREGDRDRERDDEGWFEIRRREREGAEGERPRVREIRQDDYERIIRAVQGLQRQVQSLRREVDQLRAENAGLRAQLGERGARAVPRGRQRDAGVEGERERDRPAQRDREVQGERPADRDREVRRDRPVEREREARREGEGREGDREIRRDPPVERGEPREEARGDREGEG